MSKRHIPSALLEPGAPVEWADKLKLPYQTIVAWRRRGVPAERVLEIENAIGVPRHEIRPDLYPPPQAAA